MPVGKGSINRASRSSKKTVKETDNKLAQSVTEAVVEEEPVVASEETKSVKKKTVAKKTVTEKKVEEKTVESIGNECCHLTEDLPVHLL